MLLTRIKTYLMKPLTSLSLTGFSSNDKEGGLRNEKSPFTKNSFFSRQEVTTSQTTTFTLVSQQLGQVSPFLASQAAQTECHTEFMSRSMSRSVSAERACEKSCLPLNSITSVVAFGLFCDHFNHFNLITKYFHRCVHYKHRIHHVTTIFIRN